MADGFSWGVPVKFLPGSNYKLVIWFFMIRLTIIFGLVLMSSHTRAQGPQVFEQRIRAILETSRDYDNIESIIGLIRWESDLIKDIPCISPLQVPDFRVIPVSSGFGHRYHPILHEYKHHSGIDIPATSADTVYATANGRIIAAGSETFLGNYIKIQHKFGFITTYGHLSKIIIAKGDSVRIAQKIGVVGSSGRSTGAHLHYGITKHHNEENAYPYCFLYIQIMLKSRREVP